MADAGDVLKAVLGVAAATVVVIGGVAIAQEVAEDQRVNGAFYARQRRRNALNAQLSSVLVDIGALQALTSSSFMGSSLCGLELFSARELRMSRERELASLIRQKECLEAELRRV